MIANCSRTTVGGAARSVCAPRRAVPAAGGRTPGLHAPDELEHLVAARHERDDEVVVTDLPDLLEPRLRQVPRVLVVEHHRQAVERLELRRPTRCSPGSPRSCGSRSPDRASGRQKVRFAGSSMISATVGFTGGSSAAWWRLWRKMPNSLAEDAVLGLGVPGRGQLGPRFLDGRHLALTLLPRRQQRQEDVIPIARKIAPSGRALLVHRHRVAVAPDEVHREVAQQRGARTRTRPTRPARGSRCRSAPSPRSRA